MVDIRKRIVDTLKQKKISFYAYLVCSFIFIALMPLIAFSYINYVKVEEVIRDDATRSAEVNLNYISENIDNYLDELDSFCTELLSKEGVAAYFRVKPSNSADLDHLRKQAKEDLQNSHIFMRFQSIILYPKNGEMFSYGILSESSIDDFRKYSVYIDAMNNWGTSIYVPLHEYVGVKPIRDNPEIFSFAKSLKDIKTYEQLGVIEITFEPEFISGIISSSSNIKSNEILLVSENKRIMAGTDNSLIGSTLANDLSQIIDNNQSGKKIKTQNGSRIIVVSKLKNTNWKLIEEIEYERLINSATILKNYFILIILLIAAFTGVIILLAILLLTHSIRTIIRAITNIKNGDLQARSGKIHFAEFDYIGKNINEMAEKITIYIDKAIDEQKQKRVMELKMLQAQITPHFLYNALYSIRCMAINRNESGIATNIDALILLLKTSISDKTEMLTIKEELEIVECFMALERTRSNNKFHIVYETDQALSDCKIPKMVLQPIVENCIMHAFPGEKSSCEIKISILEVGEDILITVLDNGQGMDMKEIASISEAGFPSKRRKFSGIGLENVDKKIKLYFGDRYGLNILSEKGHGTLVSMLIPKHTKDGGVDNA